jgi:hypothetical protein
MTAPFDLAETDRLLSTTRAVRKRLDLDKPAPTPARSRRSPVRPFPT